VNAGRISLRLLAAGDQDLYCELYTDAATMRFIGAPLSRERALRSFEKALQLTHRGADTMRHLVLAVIEKASRQTIGICSIQQFDERLRCAEAGIILRPAMHARGIGKEAFAALITQGFAILQIDELRAHIAVDNSAAAGVLARLGFRRCDDAAASAEGPQESGQKSGQKSEQGGAQKSAWSVARESWCRNP
jgi:RimJ/RimL family protein N-acetyltransferase